MFQRNQLETILKINGVSINASPDEIREILLRASYNNEEIESAIMLLKENSSGNPLKFTDLQKVFLTTDALKPAEISALLGIEVQIGNVQVTQSRSRELTGYQTAIVTALAIIIAILGVGIAMYIYEVGFFHPTASAFGASKTYGSI